MKKSHSFLCTIFLTLVLALSISNANPTAIRQDIVAKWCVAKANAADNKLKEFIDGSCSAASRSSSVDCTAILPGGACYEPNTLRDHASYILNLFYKSRGQCNPDIGIIVAKNPSTKSCSYPKLQ